MSLYERLHEAPQPFFFPSEEDEPFEEDGGDGVWEFPHAESPVNPVLTVDDLERIGLSVVRTDI